MTTKPRRMGRPLKEPEPGKRVSLGLKVTADIKRRIDGAAREKGRTQSQEAEFRLQQSFSEEDALLGPELRNVQLTMIAAFFSAGSQAAAGKGHPEWKPSDWLKDEDCYIAAMFEVLTSLLLRAPNANPDKILLMANEIRARVVQSLANQERIKLTP